MYKLKSFPKTILKMIYHSIILPYLYYNIIVWGNSSVAAIDRIIKLQKRAVRIIDHASFLAHTSPIFCSLKILRFNDLYVYQVGIFMYLCHKNLLPESLLTYFSLNCDIHKHRTRNATDFHLPLSRTTLSKKSVIYQGPITWNSLPSSIKELQSFNVFKKSSKEIILANYHLL